MTTSNLDLARECGAFNPGYENARPGELLFTPAQLDAFAARIRADALASAPVQPVALVNTLLLEAEKFWWNDGPEGKTADDMNAAKDAVLRALAAPQPQQIAEPASQWISVNERLPLESDGTVAVLMDDGSVLTAWATYWHGASAGFAQWTHPFDVDDAKVTHWVPLPAQPEATPKETTK